MGPHNKLLAARVRACVYTNPGYLLDLPKVYFTISPKEIETFNVFTLCESANLFVSDFIVLSPPVFFSRFVVVIRVFVLGT